MALSQGFVSQNIKNMSYTNVPSFYKLLHNQNHSNIKNMTVMIFMDILTYFFQSPATSIFDFKASALN